MKLFTDVPTGGWQVMRFFFAISALLTWLPKGLHLEQNYSAQGIVLPGGPMRLTHYVIWSPQAAWMLWAVLILSLLVLAIRYVRLCPVLFFVCAICLLGAERLNMKAYDRLLLWQALALIFAPQKSPASPFPRYFLILIYCGLYASTGFLKLLVDPTNWLYGRALAYDLVDRNFGGFPLGIWLSDKAFLLIAMSWGTLLFEILFPIFIWWRVTNKWILIMGGLFHLSILLTMNVGTFSLVACSAYPVLLHPLDFQELKISFVKKWKNRLVQTKTL